MKFDLNSLQNELFHFIYKGKLIKEVISTIFLDLEIDKHMNWRNHIVHMLPKSCSACYAIRCMYNFSNIERIKIIYYAYFHSIMMYGMVFWG